VVFSCSVIAASCVSVMCVLITSPTRSVLLTHILVIHHRKLEKTGVGLAFCGMTFIPYFVNNLLTA
jgi:hypothetical protein